MDSPWLLDYTVDFSIKTNKFLFLCHLPGGFLPSLFKHAKYHAEERAQQKIFPRSFSGCYGYGRCLQTALR